MADVRVARQWRFWSAAAARARDDEDGHAYAPAVLLWINGPFGGGKTQVAQNRDTLVRARLRRAWIGVKHLRLD